MNFEMYAALPTEQMNPRSKRLDTLSALQIVHLMNREDAQVLRTIRRQAKLLAQASDRIVTSWRSGGRLFLVGAGTSGRLAILEAAECPPTFNTLPVQIQAIMAGGPQAVFRSREGAEDSSDAAAREIRRRVRKGDVVIGIAASGITPFVSAALKAARAKRAIPILLTCNPRLAHAPVADVVIALDSGPEVLSGSTRLKAGTACKMALNMLTTASLVRLGKAYGNRMVDVQPNSLKLKARSLRLIESLGGVSSVEAGRLLALSGREAKTAIVMARKGCSATDARRQLKLAHGFLRKVIG
jgi:N-acetylmuramic acid 6-phosphate etherase